MKSGEIGKLSEGIVGIILSAKRGLVVNSAVLAILEAYKRINQVETDLSSCMVLYHCICS